MIVQPIALSAWGSIAAEADVVAALCSKEAKASLEFRCPLSIGCPSVFNGIQGERV